jgi:hypothetical protein
MGRRNPNARRDRDGRSREYIIRHRNDYEQTLARRSIELIRDGIEPSHSPDRLAGFTLGRLLLRHRQSPRSEGSITERQYNAGSEWTAIVHRHAAINGYRLTVHSPSFSMVGGMSCARDPSFEEVSGVRRKWSGCYNALMEACRTFGGVRIRDVTYGVCVENWPLDALSRDDYGMLRVGLNAIGRALKET